MSWLVNAFVSGIAGGAVSGTPNCQEPPPEPQLVQAQQTASQVSQVAMGGGFAPVIDIKLIPPGVPSGGGMA